jgi:hypothetical protein
MEKAPPLLIKVWRLHWSSLTLNRFTAFGLKRWSGVQPTLKEQSHWREQS